MSPATVCLRKRIHTYTHIHACTIHMYAYAHTTHTRHTYTHMHKYLCVYVVYGEIYLFPYVRKNTGSINCNIEENDYQ